MFVISLWLPIFSCMTSFFSCMSIFLEAPSQYSYLRQAIDLGTIVKLEMYPTLTSKNIETLILILINIQYLQIVFFTFEWKRFEWSKSFLLKFPSTPKTIPSSQQKFTFLPTPYSNAIWTLFEGWNNLRWN